MQNDDTRREAEAELWFLVDDVCEVVKREFVDDAFLREGLIAYARSLEQQQQAQQQQ